MIGLLGIARRRDGTLGLVLAEEENDFIGIQIPRFWKTWHSYDPIWIARR